MAESTYLSSQICIGDGCVILGHAWIRCFSKNFYKSTAKDEGCDIKAMMAEILAFL